MRNLQDSIGTDAMNLFCKDVFRCALMEAGGLQFTEEKKAAQMAKREKLFADLLARATALPEKKFAQKIEIQRCVAALRLRTYSSGSAAAATPRFRRKNSSIEKWKEIEDVLEQAERYYGENGTIVKDLKSLLPVPSSPKATTEEGSSRKRQKVR